MKVLLSLVFLVTTAVSSLALAKEVRRIPSSTLSDKHWSDGGNIVYVKLVPYTSGVGFGASYEKVKSANLGWGGSLLVLPEKKEAGPGAAPGLTAIGANLYLHFPVEFVDFYVSPGLNIMLMKAGDDDSTTIGGSMAFGTLAHLTSSFSLGMELSFTQPWFNKDYFTASRAYFANTAITAAFSF